MAIKLSYDTQDEIPEAFRELYTERDGKWVLTGVEGMKTAADVGNVQNALKKEREEHTATKAKLKKFEKLGDRDVDELLKHADEVEDLRGQLEAANAGGKDGKTTEDVVRARVDAQLAIERKKFERTLADKDKAIATLTSEKAEEASKVTALDRRIRDSAIDAALTEAASKAQLLGTAIPDVLLRRGNFEVENGPDGQPALGADGKPVVKTRDGVGVTPGLDPASWLSDQKSTSPHWWPASQGGGARGAGGNGVNAGDNPFAKNAPNLDKAMAIVKQDPTKASALAKSAGFADVNQAIVAMGKAAATGKPIQ